MTPEQARKEAARLSGAVASGADPAAVRAAEKTAPTVAAFAERFLSEHVATKTKSSTAIEYRRLIEIYVLPAIGRKPMRDVTRADISRLHHDQRTKPYAANRALAVMSKMFGLAEKWGERPGWFQSLPACEEYAERKRERMLSADEFGRLADALKAPGRSPYVVAAIKLLVFTGARLSEILYPSNGPGSISSAGKRGCPTQRRAPRPYTFRLPHWPFLPTCPVSKAIRM